jgi:hypothetical protein
MLAADYVVDLVWKPAWSSGMRQYSQRWPARWATSARSRSLMSRATRKDLASSRLGHSQYVLQLHEVVELRLLFRR